MEEEVKKENKWEKRRLFIIFGIAFALVASLLVSLFLSKKVNTDNSAQVEEFLNNISIDRSTEVTKYIDVKSYDTLSFETKIDLEDEENVYYYYKDSSNEEKEIKRDGETYKNTNVDLEGMTELAYVSNKKDLLINGSLIYTLYLSHFNEAKKEFIKKGELLRFFNDNKNFMLINENGLVVKLFLENKDVLIASYSK